MFNFLNASVLIAAVAGLIPLIIHLFSRRRVTVIEFSSLKHLKAMQRRQVRRLKIRQLILLALRMLIIMCAVLAFARPTTTTGSIGSHANVSAVILIDNSASMSRYATDGILLDLAKKRGATILKSFGEGDAICVIPLDRTASPGFEPSFMSSAGASEVLNAVKQGYGAADIGSSLESAAKLLADAHNVNKELYVFSDRQRNSLPDSLGATLEDVSIFIVDVGMGHEANHGITSVSLGGKMLVPGQEFDIVATVKNYSPEPVSDAVASLFINGERVAQTSVSADGHQETDVRFTRTLLAGGLYDGFVELSDDSYLIDNRYHFSFRVPERFKVLVVPGDVSGQFVSLALTPSQGVNQYWDVETRQPDQLTGVNFLEYDVICVAGVSQLTDAIGRRIIASVQNGTSLFLSYGAATNPISFNETWGAVSGVTINEGIQHNPTQLGYFTLASMDFSHPIFSVFAESRDSIPSIKFFTLPKTTLSADAQVLATFSGNRPALITHQFGRGRAVTMCGPLSPAFSDITSQAFFVPFVSRIAEYLASHLSTYDVNLLTTEPVVRQIQLGTGALATLTVISPDSTEYGVVPNETSAGSLAISPRPTNLPGVYHVLHNHREIDRFAVNVPPSEGDFAPADIDQFAKAIGADDYLSILPSDNAASIIGEKRHGRELWHLFLWAAAIFMIAELIISKSSSPEAD